MKKLSQTFKDSITLKVKTKDINSPNVPVVVKEVKIDEEVESSFGREGVEEKTRDWSPNVETERETRANQYKFILEGKKRDYLVMNVSQDRINH